MADVTLNVRSGFFLFPEMEWEETPSDEIKPEKTETTTEQEGEN